MFGGCYSVDGDAVEARIDDVLTILPHDDVGASGLNLVGLYEVERERAGGSIIVCAGFLTAVQFFDSSAAERCSSEVCHFKGQTKRIPRAILVECASADGHCSSLTIGTFNGSCTFRVEEYKRPTFEVEFEKVTADYKDGDTVAVKGTARSYAGVPVQEAKVKYRVIRRACRWWWVDSDDECISEGETTTASDGTFMVRMPMNLPKTDSPMFYSFACIADVTDQAGETHQGQMSLPLGNRKTAFSIDIAEQIRTDQGGKVAFQLRNAAGNDIDGTAKYHINNGKWLTAQTNTPIDLPKLASGRYTLEAICGEDTVKQAFTVFSLDDKRPAYETDCWFYQSDYRFPNDGTPVTIQVGSSAKDVHIVYSVISGNRVIESGAVDRSNELINRKWTYKEEYGNGLLLTFAWVKKGKTYLRTFQIERPLPDKWLKLEWSTFRDRLTPGQQEEWSLTVKNPDGTPADALLMATLYDKSLDQLQSHQWSLVPYLWLPLPSTSWLHLSDLSYSSMASKGWRAVDVNELRLSQFDESIFPEYIVRGYGRFASGMRLSRSVNAVMDDGMVMMAKEAAPMAEEESGTLMNEYALGDGYTIRSNQSESLADLQRYSLSAPPQNVKEFCSPFPARPFGAGPDSPCGGQAGALPRNGSMPAYKKLVLSLQSPYA